MAGFIRNFGSAFYYYGKCMENAFRQMKNFPQYKYLTVPVYKTCVQKIGVVAATAVSFLSADLIVHQLIPQVGYCLMSYALNSMNEESDATNETCNMSYSYGKTAGWLAQAAPVMYAKYRDGR